MKLISIVTCPDGIDDCDYALIDLTPALAKLAVKRIAVLKEQNDRDLFEMCFWDFQAQYFSPWTTEGEDCGDALAETVEQLPTAAGDWMIAPDDFTVPESLVARVECSRMVVRDDGIGFVAIVKHTDSYVSTADLPLRVLEAAATEGPAADLS